MAPGEEVTVEVDITKGTVNEFAQLKIEIPDGFIASPKDNKGASFTFKDGTARWVWYSLPSDANFMIKYKLKANDNASGAYAFNGKFSYVIDNNPQSFVFKEHTIEVGGDANPAVADGGTLNADETNTQPTGNAGIDVTSKRVVTDQGDGKFRK